MPRIAAMGTAMDVVCVMDTAVGDHLEDRQCALEEIKQAVQSAGANFQRVQVRQLGYTMAYG